MDNGTQGDVDQRQTIAWLNINIVTGNDCIADRDALRGKNISFLAIDIHQQGNVGRTVRVVLNGLDPGQDIDLVALEIDDPILALVSAADMTGGDPAIVVSAAAFGEADTETLFRTISGEGRIEY